ncbi:MAG: sigma-70 family RNA polymerase sigma factor [Chitinophagaceae bacterium]|nr:sigma-70 family RNA polymerase sigma factor [Chitinophagaceae bacterium]
MSLPNEQQNAFLAMVNQHKGILYRLAKSYSADTEEQADMVQEMILQLWHAFSRFEGKSQFSTWMYRVCVNTMMTYHRQRRREQGEQTAWFHWSEKSTFQPEKESVSLELLYKAIRTLDDLERGIFFQYLEGLSGKEIALNIGISEGAIRVRINRIKEKLKKTLVSYGYQHD